MTAESSYVGAVEGTEAYLALVTNGREVTGYICDGAQLSMWFAETEIRNEAAELVCRRGQALGASR